MKKYVINISYILAILFSVISCSKPMTKVTNLNQVAGNETVIVGKVIIIPELKNKEQLLDSSYEKYRKRIFLMTGKKNAIKYGESYSDSNDGIDAKLNEQFFVKTTKNKFYIINGVIVMRFTGSRLEKATLPSTIEINNINSAKAIYIGTIVYYRDEYFRITKIKILDEYNKAARLFKKKFDRKVRLTRSLARVVK